MIKFPPWICLKKKHCVTKYLVQTKRTTARFPLHYNAFALFYFYPNLYIKVK